MNTTSGVLKFEVGKIYQYRFICSHDTVVDVKIVKRTEKTVTIKDLTDGKETRRKIYVYDGCERVDPLGQYYMSPVLVAKNVKN